MIRSEFEERLAQILSIGEDDEEYKQMTKCLGDMGLKKSFIVKDGAYHFCWEQNDNNVGFAVKTPDCAPDEEIDKDYFEKFLAVLTNAHEQAKTVDFQASLSDLVPTNVDDDDDDDDLSELDIEDEDPEYDENDEEYYDAEFDDDEEYNEIKKIIIESRQVRRNLKPSKIDFQCASCQVQFLRVYDNSHGSCSYGILAEKGLFAY